MKTPAPIPINRSLIAAAFLLAATPFTSQAALQVHFPDGAECRPLIAGQHIEAGEVIGLLAGHAAVRRDNGAGGYRTETGWIDDGEQIVDRGSRAMFSSIEFTCPPDAAGPPSEEKCRHETAYALGHKTFIDLGITSSRWGWQITVNESDKLLSFPLFAGAGQNDITQGTEVGILLVRYLEG